MYHNGRRYCNLEGLEWSANERNPLNLPSWRSSLRQGSLKAILAWMLWQVHIQQAQIYFLNGKAEVSEPQDHGSDGAQRGVHRTFSFFVSLPTTYLNRHLRAQFCLSGVYDKSHGWLKWWIALKLRISSAHTEPNWLLVRWTQHLEGAAFILAPAFKLTTDWLVCKHLCRQRAHELHIKGKK